MGILLTYVEKKNRQKVGLYNTRIELKNNRANLNKTVEKSQVREGSPVDGGGSMVGRICGEGACSYVWSGRELE